MDNDTLLFIRISLAVGFVLWAVLQAGLLRSACSIYNGISGGTGGAGATIGVPEPGMFKALGVVVGALILNVLASWLLLVMFQTPLENVGGSGPSARLITQTVGVPLTLVLLTVTAALILPTSFGRALMVSLIQTGLYLVVCLLLFGFLMLLIAVNGPWTSDSHRAYNLFEIGTFVIVALLLEVPVFYASTALAGYEPSVLKTFVVPMATAAIWGAGAAVAVFVIGTDWLLVPEHRWSLVGFISAVLGASLVVQMVLFYLLVPTSVFGGVLTSVFQLLLRILLYVLLLAVDMVFLGALQILRGPTTPGKTAQLLAPLLDALACLT